MSGADLAVIGAAKNIWDMLIGLLKGSAEDKKSFLEHYVEPLQARLIDVHQHYIATFQEVQKHLRDRTKPPSYLIEFLLERKRSYQHEHQLVMDLAAEIGRPDNARFHGRKLKTAISDYSSAVSEYFGITQHISYPSWYTDFIRIVERNVQRETKIDFWATQAELENPRKNVDVWETLAISGDPRQELLNDVNALLDRLLPEYFGRVSQTYARLRMSLV